MALQDGLLSFQIKETVFLSSDKVGIGELKELELVPDVEIIENPQEVSITGCLQLFGKYDPYQEKTAEVDGETDTLVAAMKFTPFQLEENQAGFLSPEEQTLTHRVPLSISIPLNRIDELSDIYAIVDSFDYQLESPNELKIQATLKIAGIGLRDQEVEQQDEPEAAWEFVHTVGREEPQTPQNQHPSLEEIERKLAALEEEILAQEKQEQPPLPSAPNVFIASEANPNKQPQALAQERSSFVQPVSAPMPSEQPPQYGDLSAYNNEPEIEATTHARQELEIEPAQYAADNWNEQDAAAQASYEEEQQQEEIVEAAVNAVPDEVEETAAQQVEEAEEAEEVFAEQPSAEPPQEMKVAIGSKNTPEAEAKVNITSIFTHSKRAEQPQAAGEAESTASSSRRQPSGEVERTESLNNLTSFVRETEEKMSKLRIAIVQRNETIESIADRYSLPVSRILDVNKVTPDRITEGQILYIPK